MEPLGTKVPFLCETVQLLDPTARLIASRALERPSSTFSNPFFSATRCPFFSGEQDDRWGRWAKIYTLIESPCSREEKLKLTSGHLTFGVNIPSMAAPGLWKFPPWVLLSAHAVSELEGSRVGGGSKEKEVLRKQDEKTAIRERQTRNNRQNLQKTLPIRLRSSEQSRLLRSSSTLSITSKIPGKLPHSIPVYIHRIEPLSVPRLSPDK